MHLAFVATRSQAGLSAPPITVEVHLSHGLPAFQVVGLSESSTREIRSRVRSAIISSHLKWPDFNITVNLAPTAQRKHGARYDLPIALGLLVASKQLPRECVTNREFFGELGLDGSLRSFPGALSAVLAATQSGHCCGVARDRADKLAVIENSRLIAAPDLLTLCGLLKTPSPPLATPEETLDAAQPSTTPLAQLRGQPLLARALELAAAGGHHLMMIGPPGVGKTLGASALPGLLPQPHRSVLQELQLLHDIAGSSPPTGPAFRAPHHSSSVAALLGGTAQALPGEISMAHGGVLFLDELAEFPRAVLNQLRQPMESGEICISRAEHQHRYPARFQLVAAMNPCPCGQAGGEEARCRCTPDAIRRYRHSVSGPLMDRIDLHITLSRVAPEHLLSPATQGSHSADIKNRIHVARERQLSRQGELNRDLSGDDLLRACALSKAAQTWFVNAIETLKLSARSAHRRLRVGRTLADLEGCEAVSTAHLQTALSFRETSAIADAAGA